MARRCCIDRTSSAAGALQIGSSTLGVGVAQLSVVQIGTDRFQIAAAGEEPAGICAILSENPKFGAGVAFLVEMATSRSRRGCIPSIRLGLGRRFSKSSVFLLA